MNSNLIVLDNRTMQKYRIAVGSDIGRRENQQDAALCYADDEQVFALVCDGMGGLAAGERASKLSVQLAEEFLTEQHARLELSPEWMADLILNANARVCSLCDEEGNALQAGSTWVSVFIRNQKMYWASVGDSRVYLFHGKEHVQLTTDLNYAFVLQQKLENGEISNAKYQEELAEGESLTSFLGVGAIDTIDRNTEPFELRKGDFILICSDGLYKTIDAEWLGDILEYSYEPNEIERVIGDIIRENGPVNQDNYSYISIEIM